MFARSAPVRSFEGSALELTDQPVFTPTFTKFLLAVTPFRVLPLIAVQVVKLVGGLIRGFVHGRDAADTGGWPAIPIPARLVAQSGSLRSAVSHPPASALRVAAVQAAPQRLR